MSDQLNAAPLASLLADYEDAVKFAEPVERKQIKLVGSCLRLGGLILSSNPGIDHYNCFTIYVAITSNHDRNAGSSDNCETAA